MENLMTSKNNTSKFIAILAIVTVAILLIPLTVMQFTGGVDWTLSDFIFAGGLIFGTGLTFKLITQKSRQLIYKAAIGLSLATGFMLIWANGAVGIIGSEDNPINLLYFAVLLIGMISAFITRFQPKGMAFTMFLTAAAQALVAAIALIGGFYQSPPSSVVEILGINAFFILLWIGSGLMFRYIENE